MIISDYKERRKRAEDKEKTLLNFLKQETYSDFDNIMNLLGYKNKSTFYRLVNRLADTHPPLIKKYETDFGTIWGITQDGIARVFTPDESVFPNRFESSKFTGWTTRHHLDNQKARLILQKNGATDWINADRAEFMNRYKVKHRPDGLFLLPDGKPVAVETERRMKTKARYQSIMASHLLARASEQWFYVFYIVPDEQYKVSLQGMFDRISYVIVNNTHAPLQEKHRRIFRIYTLAELQYLSLENYV